jgi:ammonium transporter Rh
MVDLPLLIDAAFAAAAAMISFGAVLGKTSPTQLLWLVVLEVPVYALNAHLVRTVPTQHCASENVR